MEDEVTLERDGLVYTAMYLVEGDTLTVFLPNGEQRTTELQGVPPKTAARPHLRSYINGISKKK